MSGNFPAGAEIFNIRHLACIPRRQRFRLWRRDIRRGTASGKPRDTGLRQPWTPGWRHRRRRRTTSSTSETIKLPLALATGVNVFVFLGPGRTQAQHAGSGFYYKTKSPSPSGPSFWAKPAVQTPSPQTSPDPQKPEPAV
jgi:hypothetical protein